MQTTKRTDSGTPTLSWCIIARNCESTIEATLKSLRERTPQAEIVVVDTCSSDSTPEIAKRYADVWEEYKGPRGDWDTEMLAFDDASAARQRSFEIASGTWRGWIDTDDILPGPEEVERLLKLNGQFRPDLGARETIDTVGEPITLEQMLLDVDEKYADEVKMINAPYLYQRDDADRALVWQTRERIVRWEEDNNWKWMEKSHEVLCPINAVFGTRIDFSGLLFVHEKVHDAAANHYALRRHFDVLIKQYDEGDKTTRRCLYLSQYAKVLCPEREAEFIDAAHENSGNRLDRYRSKIAEAEYYANRGLYTDHREALGAAVDLIPKLPDAWILGGQIALGAEDWGRARTWLENGLEHPVSAQSLLIPRQMQIWNRVQLAAVYEKLAGFQIAAGEFDEANLLYVLAENRLAEALCADSIGPDREKVAAIYRQIQNARHGNVHAIELAKVATYLVNNDEPAKVLSLIEAFPHTLEDHPVKIELERWSERLRVHLCDDAAYKHFYLTSEDVGQQQPSPEWMIQTKTEASRQWVARAYWAADIVAKYCPSGTILDVGCYDGLSCIPLMELCPDLKYVGIDLNEYASQRLRERFKKVGMEDRATVLVNPDMDPTKFIADLVKERGEKFDMAMWFEVIEHVPVIKTYTDALLGAVKPGGQLLITTPWGAFDDGLPAVFEHARDERGHVRAMTARNFYDEMGHCGAEVGQLYNHVLDMRNGADTLHASVTKARRLTAPPVAFAVCTALWDWNSSEVHRGGFGASEETICYLGESLAWDRKVNVFGPTPEEEVQASVGYWPHAQLRHITPDTKVVVSRAPSWGTVALDELVGFETEKYLWLQDAQYDDLNRDVAANYKKIVCVGEWQKGMMHTRHGVPLAQMEVIGNFLLPEHFVLADRPKREPHHFIYASSPDRGLINLLRLWPEVLAMYPDATLDIFYGWRGINKLGSGVLGNDQWVSRFEKVRRDYEGLRYQKGIKEVGMVSHAQIAREFMRASAWLYPTSFTETFCSNAVKARAAGCVPVTTGLAALNETAICDQSIVIPFDETLPALPASYGPAWLEGVKQAVETSDAERDKMSVQAIAEYNVSVQAAKWRALLR